MSEDASGKRPGASKSAPASERIAKRLARAGLCSRREAERWIEAGRVAVDGKVLTSPAVNVAGTAIVTVDGKPIPEPERARLWRYHKPRDVVCQAADARGRKTLAEALPPGMPRVIAAGALDPNAEGLMLLTNDGGLKRHLELPATGWVRRYRVRAFGKADAAKLAALAKGVRIGGVDYGPIEAALEVQKGSNCWLAIGLHEGRNRDVRRVVEHLGLSPSRIIRIAYGPFQLGNLEEGAVAEVTGKVMREQIGGEFAEKPKREKRR